MCYLKLGRYRESSKLVATRGWPTLFGVTKLDYAEIPRNTKELRAMCAR